MLHESGLSACTLNPAPYRQRMLVFFQTKEQINAFLERVHVMICPSCGASGALRRHGTIRGYVSPKKRGIRAWRIHCKRSRGGCGRAPSVRLSSTLRFRCITAPQLWDFMLALKHAPSVKAAWEEANIPLSLDSGYALYKRLWRCQSIIRTRLHSRAPPRQEERCAESSLLQMFTHLQDTFEKVCVLSAFQHLFQTDFMGVA